MTGDPLIACLAGRLSPEVAIGRLLLGGGDAAGIRRRILELRCPNPAWAELAGLSEDETSLDRLRRMIDMAGVDHAGAATPAGIAALFDRAVAISPEGSVALYSLGNPERLRAATSEIVAWLERQRLIGPDTDVLDIGCGIGRIAAAIAGRVRTVHGIDASLEMVREAARRCTDLANISFSRTEGRDLSMIADEVFDLILAVDSFPYLMQAGVAERHVAEACRVLRKRGCLVVLNWSYRGNPVTDRTDAEAWAEESGLFLEAFQVTPFRLWDAAAFVLRRR